MKRRKDLFMLDGSQREPLMHLNFMCACILAHVLPVARHVHANLQEKSLRKDGGNVDGASLQCIMAFSYVCQVLK